MKTKILAVDWVLHNLEIWHDSGDRDGNVNMAAV